MTPLKLDLHSLIVFYHIASEGSITAAADKMCLTQPTVTYHIRSLERNTGLKLLDIKRQKVFLTRAGAGLFRYVSEIHQQMSSAEKYLENLKEASFRVGVATTFSTCVAGAVSEFEKHYPRVKMIIRSAPSLEVIDDVLNSEVDVGIVVSMDYGNPKLKVQQLSAREQLVLVASPSNPITQRKRLNFLNICGYPLVLGPETSATRRIIMKRLSIGGCRIPSPIIIEVNSTDWGIKLVENGQGVGLHHIRSVADAIVVGRLRALPLPGEIWVGADALVRADAPEHPIVPGFISLVKAAFENRSHGPFVGTGAAPG